MDEQKPLENKQGEPGEKTEKSEELAKPEEQAEPDITEE